MRGGRRLVSLSIVAALHVAIVAALLSLSHERIVVPRAQPSEELIWFLPPPPKKAVVAPKPERMPPPRAAVSAPRNLLPDYRGITIPNAPPVAPAPGGLHGSLFGCADLDHLSPEERAHCGSALTVPNNAVDFRDGVNRSRSAALWERGRLRKNGPLLLPCIDPHKPAGADILGTAFCLAKGAVTGGIRPEEQPLYADAPPEVTHLPNNGDPPDHPGF